MRRYAMYIYDLKRNFVNNSSKEDNEPPWPFEKNLIGQIEIMAIKLYPNFTDRYQMMLQFFFFYLVLERAKKVHYLP